MVRITIVIFGLLTAGVSLLVTVVTADEMQQNDGRSRFCIDNRLIIGDKAVKSLTIFYDGRVYDFIGDHGQITIYDKAAGMLTLLDPSCRLKTTVTTENLAEDFIHHREALRKSDNPFHNYLAEPFFEENAFEAESGLMYFRSPWIEYRFETVPLVDPVVSEVYYDFCRQFTLLNIRTGSSPTSMIRNALNPILEQHQRFPGKINMTIYPRGKVILSRMAVHAEATHTFVWRLQSPDETKVKQANRCRELFREVPLDNYLREVNR